MVGGLVVVFSLTVAIAQAESGTPTVGELLNKVKENYTKIEDLKADANFTVPIEEIGTVTQTAQFLFKASDKLKIEPEEDEDRATIIKSQVMYLKDTETGAVTSALQPWDINLHSYYLCFYYQFDDFQTKFDMEVIGTSGNTYIIEATPKPSNPDNMFNYPPPNGKLKLYVEYEKGIITKIEGYDTYEDDRLCFKTKLEDFMIIDSAWIPTVFKKTVFIPVDDGEQEIMQELELSNVEINTGIPDSEFEF
jgi:outer membrane lipoprotein-sorting protein